MNCSIPTYAADGARIRNYSAHAIEGMEARQTVTVQRGRQGQILSARLNPAPEPKPTQAKSISTGTYYSYEAHAGDRLLWQHKNLLKMGQLSQIMGSEVDDPADVERFLLTIFFAVPLSCIPGLALKQPAVIRRAMACSLGQAKAVEIAARVKLARKASRKAARAGKSR